MVNGGNLNAQNTTFGSLIHSSGVTTFGPAVTIGTADVSAGSGTVNATTPVVITGTLKLPGGVTASVVGGNLYGWRDQSGQLHSPNNYTLSTGTVTLLCRVPGHCIAIVGDHKRRSCTREWVQLRTPAPFGTTRLTLNSTLATLVDSFGGATGLSFSASGQTGDYNLDTMETKIQRWPRLKFSAPTHITPAVLEM